MKGAAPLAWVRQGTSRRDMGLQIGAEEDRQACKGIGGGAILSGTSTQEGGGLQAGLMDTTGGGFQ